MNPLRLMVPVLFTTFFRITGAACFAHNFLSDHYEPDFRCV